MLRIFFFYSADYYFLDGGKTSTLARALVALEGLGEFTCERSIPPPSMPCNTIRNSVLVGEAFGWSLVAFWQPPTPPGLGSTITSRLVDGNQLR